MEIKKQLTINTSADKLLNILGTDSNDIADWTSAVYVSYANPDLEEGEEGRVCQTQFGNVTETLTQIDADQRDLAHQLEGRSTPFLMQDVLNIWRIEPQGDDRAVVHLGVEANCCPSRGGSGRARWLPLMVKNKVT